MTRVFALVLSVIAWAGTAAAGPFPQAQQDLFTAFARDVSDGDLRILDRVHALIETPPTTLEDIGFYGMTKAPPAERTIRGIISLLGAEGYLFQVEDKYVYELAEILVDASVLSEPVPDPYLDIYSFFEEAGLESAPTDEDWQRFRLWFVGHVDAIENGVGSTGRELLSINMPLGDTLFFWTPRAEVAERWRGRALYAGVNTLKYANTPLTSVTVTDPDWANYWFFMTYALRIPDPFQALPQALQ